MSETSTRTGSCLCGKVKYEVTGEPFMRFACHCSNCKKATGSAFSAPLFFKKDQVKITDEEHLVRTYVDTDVKSGGALNRHFCGNCGSTLGASKSDKDMIGVSTGVLGDIKGWHPTAEFFCDDKRDWLPEFPGTERRAIM